MRVYCPWLHKFLHLLHFVQATAVVNLRSVLQCLSAVTIAYTKYACYTSMQKAHCSCFLVLSAVSCLKFVLTALHQKGPYAMQFCTASGFARVCSGLSALLMQMCCVAGSQGKVSAALRGDSAPLR